MFKDLHKLIKQQSEKATQFKKLDSVNLTESFINAYREESRDEISIYDDFSKIKSSNDLILYFPNQWFYLAFVGAPIYNELMLYKNYIVDNLQISNSELREFCRQARDKIISEEHKRLLFENLNSTDSEYLYKFLTDPKWWNSGKTIDRGDFFISPILSSLKLINDSSSYVALIAQNIARNEFLLNSPENQLFNFQEKQNDEDIDTYDSEWIARYKIFLKNCNTINSDQTITNYVRYIKETTISKLDGIENAKSVFAFRNIDAYLNYYNKLIKSKNFHQVNRSTNGSLKSSLQHYRNFLVSEENKTEISHNQIFSGAPGTGKSYNVSKLVKEYYPDFENEENEQSQFVFRTTLHPEYTYSDFVGQIMPVTKDDKIDYDFIPGVFTRALEKAISFEQTNQKVFLILEELSRANVASVFGDLFQLLDRKNGKSEYPISNSLIAKEVFHSGPLKNEDGSINKENEKLQNKKIYLPSNLYILCTVNTSDQNVFVMDTAFKRRFDWIPVLTDPVKNLKTGDYINNPEITIDGVKLKWCEFYPILNNYITSKMGLSEDKQIGQFFIKFDDNSSTEVVQTLLKNKLLQYLWDDVENAAYSKKLFEGITSFSELYKKFGVTQIFNAELITELNNIKNSDIEMTNDNQSIELNNNVELDENLVEE
ncbi:AAA family ATPase [Streptococcus uberis]|uniref:AAA family ATPase n=1 Tax=Streptococcus uberis TaxID=1349 RepID=UPI0020C09871|nr:AAA family ATPase [Streptococcus uberis]